MNKKAFTLAEALVVILIIGIVAGAALNNVSKKTPQRSDEAQHGQYACWVEDPATNRICEQEMIGRSTEGPRCTINRECTFESKRKIAQHIIYIVGAGVGDGKSITDIQGQFVSASLGGADIVGKVPIILGGTPADNSRGTSLSRGTSFGDREDLFAANGRVNVTNGLITENIKSCRIISAIGSNQCVAKFETETAAGDFKTTMGRPLSCVFKPDGVRVGQPGNIVRIDGCKTLVDINSEVTAGGTVYKATEIDAMIRTADLVIDPNREKGLFQGRAYDESTHKNTVYQIRVQLHDSDYTNLPNLVNGEKPKSKSKMAALLDVTKLPKFRQSEITGKLYELNPGIGANGKGAVFIMW